MVKIFLRKIQTGLRLIKNYDWNKFSERLQRNIMQLKLGLRGGRTFTYRTKIGFKFISIPNVGISERIYMDGFPEEIEAKIAYHYLKKGDCCLDIGANIGYFTALFAERVTSSGKVIAAEASPKSVRYLKKLIQELGLKQVFVEDACIMDRSGFTEFMVSVNDEYDVKQSLKVSPQDYRFYTQEKVRAVTIDELVKKYEIDKNVSLVKIDIEGAEPLALSKAASLFDKEALPLFMVEVNKETLSRLNFTPQDILKFFSDHLFEIYFVQSSFSDAAGEFKYGLLYRLSNPSMHNWPWLSNIIVVPKGGKFSSYKSKIKKYLPA